MRSELASDSKDKKEYFSVLSHKIDIINTPPTPFTDNLPLHDMHNGVEINSEVLFSFLIVFSLKIVLHFHYICVKKNTTWQFLHRFSSVFLYINNIQFLILEVSTANYKISEYVYKNRWAVCYLIKKVTKVSLTK